MAEGIIKKKVMVAVDESDCSYYALQWALENLANTISDSQLIIFHSSNPIGYASLAAATYGAPPPGLIANIEENQRKLTSALLDKAKDVCAKHGVVAETIAEIGDPKEKICEAVEKLSIQFLVLGSHGRGAIKRAFLGSVSNYCVHNVKCPVLVVKKAV
ncbi:hypothetical protein SLE2022_218630 [Rubroshorea leprosula]